MPNQTMQGLAGILAEQGRYGDTMLMHVAPSEVKYLADLGGITENPMTGLPEAFKFKDLLPFVGSAFLGPAFKAVGFSPGVSSFLASTASTMIGGGSLEKGIMSGLVSSSLGRLGRNLAATSPDAASIKPATDTGSKFRIFETPKTGTFGSRYAEAFQSPEFNPIEMAKAATTSGLDNFMEQIQKPGVLLPLTTGLGELARINAEEDYIRQYQNFLTSQADRRRQLQSKYPQIVPSSNPYYRKGMAEGGIVQRKFDGDLISFDQFNDQGSEEWFLWSDGTYNRLPEETGVRTPYDQLPDTYKAADTRSQQAAVPADRPLIDEPIYTQPSDELNQPVTLPSPRADVPSSNTIPGLFVDGFTPPEGMQIGEGDYDAMQRVMASLSLMPPDALAGLTATSFADPNVAASAQFRQDTRAGLGSQGALYEEGALEAAKAYAADPTKGIFSAGFQALLAEDPTGTQAAIEAKAARDLAALSQVEADFNVMKPLSDLLKANKFQEAFAYAQEKGVVDKLMDTNVLRELRPAFTRDEMQAFFAAIPPDYAGSDYNFDPSGGANRSADPFGTGQGMDLAYPDPTQAFKRKDDKTIENIAKVAGALMLATAVPGLIGGTGGSTAATTTAASGASGASALTGVIPTGLVPGTTAAAVAAAGVPLAEVTVIASKLALSIPQAAALISSVGLGTAQALAGGTATPTATTAAAQPTAPSPEALLDEVVVTGNRALDPALRGLLPTSLASTNLVQGVSDIPTDIYGRVAETTPQTTDQVPEDFGGEYVVEANRLPYLDIAALGTVPALSQQLINAGYQPPVFEATPLDEVVVRTTTPPKMDLIDLGLGGVTAAQIAQGFTQPNVDPLTGETRVTSETEQALDKIGADLAAASTTPTPNLLDRLIKGGQNALTDAATSQLLAALAGGAAGGVGAGAGGGGGYAGTGGLGYIPEGQERKYFGAPGDYRHGFLPEWMFFTNLNPPAVIDTTQPGTTTPGGSPGTRPGTTPDDRIEPKAAGGTIKSYSPRGYLEMIQGYNEGGEIEETMMEDSDAPMTDGSRQLIPLTQAAILGQLPEDQTDDVIQKFIDLHGNRAFRKLREETLESVANGSRKEGMVEGHTGGMDDMVDGVIGSSERVAVSPGEFIIPADVVSMLGDGNSDSGRHKLEQMMSRVRKDKTGSTKQARPINSAKVLPA